VSDRTDRIESEVTAAVAGAWGKEVETFRKALLALWSARGERLTSAEVRSLASRLDVRIGAVDAAGLLTPAAVAGDAKVRAKTAVHLSTSAVAALGTVHDKPPAAVAEMLKRATVLDLSTLPGVLGIVAPLSRSVTDMRAAASVAVQTAANEATVSAAAQAEAKLVFVPERDACLDCIGLGGATGDAIEVPPIHPFCRCELEEYVDEDVPLALRRESVRSVLRGFSLPSESEAARLRAAKEMLARRPAAPESVKAYARQALKRGKFGRGRGVPGSR
jgi:hypothetical protein